MKRVGTSSLERDLATLALFSVRKQSIYTTVLAHDQFLLLNSALNRVGGVASFTGSSAHVLFS